MNQQDATDRPCQGGSVTTCPAAVPPERWVELVLLVEKLLWGGTRPLSRTIAAILAHPDRDLRTDLVLVPVEEMRDPDADRLLDLMNDPTCIRPAARNAPDFKAFDGSFCFSRCWDRRTHIRFQTAANAELLGLLGLLHRDLRAALGHSRTNADLQQRLRDLLRDVDGFRQQLMELGVSERVSTAVSAGVVLEQDPRYREIRRAHCTYRALRLRQGACR